MSGLEEGSLNDTQQNTVLVKEIKSTPSARQKFSYYSKDFALTVIRDDDSKRGKTKIHLNNLWERITAFILVNLITVVTVHSNCS